MLVPLFVTIADVSSRMNQLTEETASMVFAKAWNRLEPDEFLSLLYPDVCYASQWVFEELVGADAITDYLRAKMKTVKTQLVNNPDSFVKVETGRTAGNLGRPCAFMTQGRGNTIQAAVVFEVSEGKIVRYDLCMPELLGAVRTGIYPI